MQLEMAKAGVNLFVEKPLSVRPAAEVAQLAHELKHIQEKNKRVHNPSCKSKAPSDMLSVCHDVLACHAALNHGLCRPDAAVPMTQALAL